MTIRPAEDGDWERIGVLGEILVDTHYAFDCRRFMPPDSLRADAYVSHLREEIAPGLAVVLVAKVSGAVVGYVFAGIEPESWKDLRHEAGYIHDLVVDAAHRRGGVGRALIASACALVRRPRRRPRDAGGGAGKYRRAAAVSQPARPCLLLPALLGPARPVPAPARSCPLGFRPSMIEMTLGGDP